MSPDPAKRAYLKLIFEKTKLSSQFCFLGRPQHENSECEKIDEYLDLASELKEKKTTVEYMLDGDTNYSWDASKGS